MAVIAANRSDTSYMAGGAVLNKDWWRLSDDLDIFHDTDEEIVATARNDIDALEVAGFQVAIEVLIYGMVECVVSKGGEHTVLQWMSETRYRYFPLVRDAEWGVRLHASDLAINKVLAASTRSKARDYLDLIAINRGYAPLGPLVMAAAGKPPNFSPQKIIEEIRRRSLSIQPEEFISVRGLDRLATVPSIRNDLEAALNAAEEFVSTADIRLVGVLAVDKSGRPVAAIHSDAPDIILRRPTNEPETLPLFGGQPLDI